MDSFLSHQRFNCSCAATRTTLAKESANSFSRQLLTSEPSVDDLQGKGSGYIRSVEITTGGKQQPKALRLFLNPNLCRLEEEQSDVSMKR